MSKDYLRAEKPFEKTLVKPANYAEQDIQLIQGKRAEAIDIGGRKVTLDDKTDVPYHALLLTTGSAPRMLDVPGADTSGVHYLRNVEDADAIRAAALKAEQIVVIGGGWIGTGLPPRCGSSTQRDPDLVATAASREHPWALRSPRSTADCTRRRAPSW